MAGEYRAAIRCVAKYLPEHIEKNDMNDSTLQKIGVEERHIADTSEAASDLAVRAAENLFSAYGIDRGDVDYLLVCTQNPDYLAPSTACIVQERLGLSQSIGALGYDLGCSGYVYGLSLAKGLIEGGLAKNVLLLTASLYTRYIDKEDRGLRPMFGDAGTATLIESVPGEQPYLDAFVFGTDGSGADKLILPAGGSRYPAQRTEEVFEEYALGRRSNYEMHMDGMAITLFSMRTVPDLVENVLTKGSITRDQLDYVIFHQASKYMLEHLQSHCELEGVSFYNDIRKVGNTSSCTIPIALDDLIAKKDFSKKRHVLLAGFGIGLSWAGCLADFSALKKRVL